MIITQVSSRDIIGGAAKAAYRLYKGLEKVTNIKSYYFVKEKTISDSNIVKANIKNPDQQKLPPVSNPEKNNLQYSISKSRTSISDTEFSISQFGVSGLNNTILRYSDIINLHWIAFFISTSSLKEILSFHSQIVWTLHDQQPITGGCHYSAGCNQFTDSCYLCPQINDPEIQLLVYKEHLRKIQCVGTTENLTIVSPSKWLANEARKSIVFKKFRVEHIPNSIPINSFRKIKKEIARNALNISQNKKVLLFGSDQKARKRKGESELLKVFEKLSACKDSIIKDMCIVTFGENNPAQNKYPLETIDFGYINSTSKLNLIYAAADITLLPSLEDNFPNIILESFSSGTPVISFNVGGTCDIIKNNFNGYLVEPFEIDMFYQAILHGFNDRLNLDRLSENSRLTIENYYTPEIQVNKYLELYKDILGKEYEAKEISPNLLSKTGNNCLTIN